MDHLETIEQELKDVLIRYLKALAPADTGDDIQLVKDLSYEHEDRLDSLECKVEDIENRLDNASLDIQLMSGVGFVLGTHPSFYFLGEGLG